jgi:hypothetical protein
MPDRVHAAVKTVKARGPDALPNPGLANAEPTQLRSCNHAVLPPRNGADPGVRRGLGAFWVHLDP